MTPRFKVDFNEWLEDDIVLFSQSDVRKDVYGNEHFLTEGLRIEICEIDYDEAGNRDDLWASGYVTTCNIPNFAYVKWCCKIDNKEVKHIGKAAY